MEHAENMTWHRMTSHVCGMVSHGSRWYGMVAQGMASYDISHSLPHPTPDAVFDTLLCLSLLVRRHPTVHMVMTCCCFDRVGGGNDIRGLEHRITSEGSRGGMGYIACTKSDMRTLHHWIGWHPASTASLPMARSVALTIHIDT